MTGQTREVQLSQAFVTLADTLVADFDLVDLLQTLVETCTRLLDVEAGGLMLRSSSGDLQVVVSTTEDVQFVEVVQLGASAGPCWECAQTGVAVSVPDIGDVAERWPAFHDAALERGFRSTHATPLRLRDQVIGTMNLFDREAGALSAEDAAASQALSDVATIGILSERAAKERDVLASQLQSALDSRVVIEQAKGILSHSHGITMDDAFASLRSFARSNNLGLRIVAAALVERRLDATRVVADSVRRRAAAARNESPSARR